MAIRKMSGPPEREDGRSDDRENNNGESKAEARLAPLEETSGASRSHQISSGNGPLAVNTGELKLPQELADEEAAAEGSFRVDPVVIGILCFSLIFIAVIAYVVWSGWEPPR